MIERMPTVGQAGQVRMYRDDQVPRMTTWAVVPNDMATVASLTRMHSVPDGASSTTFVNPLDPYYDQAEWCQDDCGWGRVVPAGRY